MNPLRTAILGGAAVLALAMGTAAAGAQTTSTTTTTTSPDGARVERRMIVMRHDGGEDGQMRRREPRDPAAAANHLRTLLQLTPAQEPALQAFLASMKPPEGPHGAHGGPGGEHSHPHGPLPTDPAARKAEMDKRMAEMKTRMAEMEKKRAEIAAMTTPQRLDMMLKRSSERMAKRQAEMQAHVGAVKSFYAALSPAQQKAFDLLHGGGAMGGGHGMGRHGEPEGPEMHTHRV